MEDDDEFGDLYTDVLQPLQMSSAPPQPPIQSTPQPHSRPIDLNDRIPSDDEEILYGSKSSSNLKFAQPDLNLNSNNRDGAGVKTEKYLPAADSGGRVLGSSSGLVKVEDKGFEQDLNCTDDVNKGELLQIKDDTMEENFGIEDAGEGEEDDFLIPGLSSSGARVSEPGGRELEGGDDWDDSDSEDDLQIVLNDNTGVGMMGMDGGGGLDGEDDEDGDNLVIVTGDVDPNHHPPMDEMQDWGEDASQGIEGGERKDLAGGDAGKADSGAAVAQKMGYSSHGYHPFHSQFKYVRPGAAPMPGAGPVATGGAPGQVRPPGSLLSLAGRGRGEWRPAGMKNVPPNMPKNFHPGWNNNGAGRGFGSGIDFTLPSHKTIFEVDIDGFEEKPWRLQGIDISDFFNFGMNEETWKEYCKQLEQHRLEATMQSKIRVYESGRTEQEYDPDLPPELAAAAGHDISSENRNIGKIDVQSDFAKASVHARMQLPAGKAIQVETGFGERLPSIDTRPPRIRDSDAIIEIVLQRSPSPEHESIPEDDVAEHLEDIPSKENKKENLETEDEIRSEDDRFDKPQAYNNGRKREVSGRRGPFVGSITGDRVPHFSQTEVEDHLDSRNRTSSYPSKKHNSPHNHIDRPMKRTAASRSPRLTDNQNEESTESVDHKQSHSSSPVTLGSADDRSIDQNDSLKDVVTAENTNDKDTLKDEKSRHKMKKQKVITQAEQFSVERGEDREGSIHSGNIRKPMKEPRVRDEKHERERHRMAMKGMEDQYSHRKWESSQGYQSHPKFENYDRKKGRESEGVWIEDMRQRSHKARENERNDQNEHRSRKQLENGGWKGDHDRDMIPVLKRDDGLKTQTRHHIIPEGMQSKREESLHSHRESSSRRKRERERDDSLQREKVERQRERDEWKEREKDKSWLGHTRLKEDSRSSNKEYPFKETGWDPISRREKYEIENVSRHRGRDDVYTHGSKINIEERISSRHERGYSAKDMHGVQEKKHKEALRRGKETDGAIHNSLATSRRNREDHSSQKSDRVSSRGNLEQRASDQNPLTRKSSKKHKEKETASSEDEQSRKGRSKLERWTSHKDTDFSLDTKEPNIKYKDNHPPPKLLEEPMKPQENLEKSKPLVEEKTEDAKPQEDKHLDTVEKLKKRSERFKLPMPSEKEALAIKKIENEPLPSAQPEARPEADVKPERPARKRRWTSG